MSEAEYLIRIYGSDNFASNSRVFYLEEGAAEQTLFPCKAFKVANYEEVIRHAEGWRFF